jgi:phosphate transport system protein
MTFQEHLAAIEGQIIELFALVALDLEGATRALVLGDPNAVKVMAERELVIDALYLKIEDVVNQQLALESPISVDLRFLLSVLRIVPELERSHDLVEHIARRAGHELSAELTPITRSLVEHMGAIGSEMWRQAADSWYQRDGSAVDKIAARDDEMDELHGALTVELARGQMPLSVIMEMTLVARFYERLGDHAVNIARRVVYLAGPKFAP